VQKIELSLDNGKTWRFCFRKMLDKPMRHGNKFWAWCHWSCEVTVGELSNSSEIIVRAFVSVT
jgi:nitrate reductase (NAD(P)H)